MTGAAPDRRQDQRAPCVMCAHGAIRHYRTDWGDGGCNDCNCPGYEPDTAALAARPAPDDGEALPGPLEDRCGCRRGMGRRDPACHSYGLCGHVAPSSPVPVATLRQAVADELARHTDTLSYTRDDDTVRLGCRCGHDRGTVTKRELASDLDGRMRAYRLHVADAVLTVLGGDGS